MHLGISLTLKGHELQGLGFRVLRAINSNNSNCKVCMRGMQG